jgi:hypothetical protein
MDVPVIGIHSKHLYPVHHGAGKVLVQELDGPNAHSDQQQGLE